MTEQPITTSTSIYHEDGDMVDIFLENPPNGNGDRLVRVCDHGMTLMRLSYSYDLDTPKKEIFNRIISEAGISEDSGNLFCDVQQSSLYPAIPHFAQTVAKVTNMRLFKREVIESMFYEHLAEFIERNLQAFRPRPKAQPLLGHDEFEVDWEFQTDPHPIYLFGIKDTSKARLATISCLQFQLSKLEFKSFMVHRDFDGLTRKDRSRITSAATKQFISLDDFRKTAQRVLEIEAA